MWLKSPGFDLQICTDDLESGMDLLEEQIDYAIRTSEPSCVEIPEAFEWTFKKGGEGRVWADLGRLRGGGRVRGGVPPRVQRAVVDGGRGSS